LLEGVLDLLALPALLSHAFPLSCQLTLCCWRISEWLLKEGSYVLTLFVLLLHILNQPSSLCLLQTFCFLLWHKINVH
jgi:hypothetical protein